MCIALAEASFFQKKKEKKSGGEGHRSPYRHIMCKHEIQSTLVWWTILIPIGFDSWKNRLQGYWMMIWQEFLQIIFSNDVFGRAYGRFERDEGRGIAYDGDYVAHQRFWLVCYDERENWTIEYWKHMLYEYWHTGLNCCFVVIACSVCPTFPNS